MSNPPRRARPKKPAQTIDLEATVVPAVGYPGPVSAEADWRDDASDLRDPETHVTDLGSAADAPAADSVMAANLSVLGEDARGEVPTHKTAAESFAEEESLRGEPHRSEFDETILAAAEPDFVNHPEGAELPAGPPPPSHDYTTTSSLHDAKSSVGSSFGGALLGAALALAGAGLLQYAGVLPSVGQTPVDPNTAQYARVDDVQQANTDITALKAEVEQLRSAQAAGGTGAGASQSDLVALTDRVTAIEQRGEARAATTTVNGQAANAAQQTADGARELAEAARAAAETVRQAAQQAGEVAGSAKTAADGARQTAETAQLAAQTAQQAAATAQQAASAAQASANAGTETITAFDKRLAAIESGNKQAGVAIAAASLKAAIDRGGPFMSELEAFAGAAGPQPAIETLRGFAAEGVPSAQALAAEWPDVEAQLMAALKPNDPNASVGDQILSGLSGLVTARPSGAPPATATGPEATVARMAAAITGGQFQTWLDAWQTLPQPAKDVSQAYQVRVDARARTEAIVGETLGNAVKAVAPAGTAG